MLGGGWGPFLQWVVRLAGDFFKLREGTGAGLVHCVAIGRGVGNAPVEWGQCPKLVCPDFALASFALITAEPYWC